MLYYVWKQVKKEAKSMDLLIVRALLTIVKYCALCGDCGKCLIRSFCGK